MVKIKVYLLQILSRINNVNINLKINFNVKVYKKTAVLADRRFFTYSEPSDVQGRNPVTNLSGVSL